MKYYVYVEVDEGKAKTPAGKKYIEKRLKNVEDRIWKYNPVRFIPFTVGQDRFFFVELHEDREMRLGKNVYIEKVIGKEA